MYKNFLIGQKVLIGNEVCSVVIPENGAKYERKYVWVYVPSRGYASCYAEDNVHKLKYDTRKVFDCQDMPDKVKEAFFSFFKNDGRACNDVYVSWQIQDEVLIDTTDDHAINKTLIDNWLIVNGAAAAIGKGHAGEEVLINHWW